MHVVLKDTALITPQPGLPVIIPNPATLLVEFQNAEGTAEDAAGATPQLRLYDPQQEPLEITETELWQWDFITERWRAEITIDVAAPPVMLAQFSRGEWQSDYFHVVRSAPRKGLGLAELVRDLAAQMPRPASWEDAMNGDESRPYMSPLRTKEMVQGLLLGNFPAQFLSALIADVYATSVWATSFYGNSLEFSNGIIQAIYSSLIYTDGVTVNADFEAPGIRGIYSNDGEGQTTLDFTPNTLNFNPSIVTFNSATIGAIRSGLRDYYRTLPVSVSTVATLPSASVSLGHISVVTDSNGSPAGATATGGGSTKAMVCSNGSVWRIIASMP